MESLKDASHLYEVERRQFHAERPGFRINELQISKAQKVPWHYHSKVQDTFYVLQGSIRIFLQEPKDNVTLKPGRPIRCRRAGRTWSPTLAKARPPSSCSRASASTISFRSLANAEPLGFVASREGMKLEL
jgi:hypothetical protein